MIDVMERIAPVEKSQEHDDIEHWVCHCSNLNTAACGKDVTDESWSDFPPENSCALCVLAWPADSPCPWGCFCDECGPQDEEE